MSVKTVSPSEFKTASASLVKEEKAATKLLSELAARRRALPRVKISSPESFTFDGPKNAKVTLLDLFESRQQLILYHFMPIHDDNSACVGCSFLMDHIPQHLAHLHSRDTTFVAVTPSSVPQIQAYKQRMGWSFPFYSSAHTFDSAGSDDEITWKPGNGYFGLAVFKKEDDGHVYHTYSTTDRGTETMLTTYALLDMTPLGRQEVGNGMNMFKLYDQY